MARILIVDDEKSIRVTLSEFVKEDGHEVLTAENAEEGLRLLQQDPIDIVVTDIILPRVTGVSLLEQIQRIRPDVLVIMITGEPTIDTAAMAVRDGAFDYLPKPIARDELRAVIASAVRVKTLADERTRLEQENVRYREHLEEEIAAKTCELRESETRYRMLFEDSPVALFQEDFSEVKAYLDGLLASGVGDIAAYFEDHPDAIDECVRRVRVDDVNEAAMTLHDAPDKGALLRGLSAILTEDSRESFVRQLLCISRGETFFESTTIDRTLNGAPKHVSLRWSVAPGYEHTMGRVLIAKSDISATVEAERATRSALNGAIEAIGLTTETRDPYTAGHQRRVTELAVAIAEEMNLDEATIEGARAAGLMHDIGKMAVPAEILSKPSALTDVEMALIQSHPGIAYDILKSVTFPWSLAEIVLLHHERIDGSGYPQGLRGDQIPVEARILAVADTVEAMASHRPYRAALGIDVALEEIERYRGIRYGAGVVDACLRLFREGRFAFSGLSSA